MTRVYSGYPVKSVVKEGISGNTDVPDMDAQELEFDIIDPGDIAVHGTEAELDTLEEDSMWVLL